MRLPEDQETLAKDSLELLELFVALDKENRAKIIQHAKVLNAYVEKPEPA